MNICIDMGHTPTSPGASGYLDELREDRKLGELVIKELERRGHVVYNSTAPDNMPYPDETNYRINYCNSRDIDLFVSIHYNAGGGTGVEVLHYYDDRKGKEIAARISSNIAECMGIINRGAKANDWVGVICRTNPTAVLIETCFVDSWIDTVAYNSTSWEDLVEAICNGIEGEEDNMKPNEVWGYQNPVLDEIDMRQYLVNIHDMVKNIVKHVDELEREIKELKK